MPNPRITLYSDVAQLVELSRSGIAAGSRSPDDIEGQVAQGTGWHLYTDLRIHSHYVCDSDSAKRLQTMKAMMRLGQVSFAVATKYGGQLLEHQGQRTHLWLPTDNSPDGERVVLTALSEIDFLVRRHVQPLIPSGWKSYVSSADHGPTIFLRSADLQGGDSIVSLSNAANRPAKQLPKLNDGDIWISGKIFSAGAVQSVLEIEKRASANPDSVEASFGQEGSFYGQAMVKFAKEHRISRDGVEPCFGFVFRADIDGFSALVANAFSNQQALTSLVAGFLDTVKQVTNYARGTSTAAFVQLPWAGDCCTLIAVQEDHADYTAARQSKTAEVPIEFEQHCGSKVIGPRLGNVGWAYSVAGGDAHGNQLGNILIATITLGGRTFLVAAGKGVRRSLDAETQLNIARQETSLFIEDKQPLKPHFRSEFHPGNTVFHLAGVLKLAKTATAIKAGAPAIITSTSSARPAPKPYHGGH